MKNNIKNILMIMLFTATFCFGTKSYSHGPKCIRLEYGLKLVYKVLGEADFIRDAKISKTKSNRIRAMVKKAARKMKRLNPKIKRLKKQIHKFMDYRPIPASRIISIKRRMHVLKWKKVYIKTSLRIAIERLFTRRQARPFIKAMQKHCDESYKGHHHHDDH